MNKNTSNINYKEKYKRAQNEISKLKDEISSLKQDKLDSSILFSDSFNLNETVKIFADLLPIVVTILDKDANYLYVNKFGLDLFGYSKEDIETGLNVRQLIADKKDLIIFAERIKNAELEDEMSNGKEVNLKKKDGSTFFGLIYSKILSNTDGEQSMLGIVINHEEYRQVSKDYIKAEEELRRLNATKDKFFSIVAHDLKNPFNAIIGFSELIISNIDEYSKDQIGSFVNVINKSSEKGYLLLENLLDWSRSQMGNNEIKFENFEISELIIENIDLISEKADLKGIEIVKNCESKHYVQADKNMINTIIRNLLTNALKFTGGNGKILIKTEIIKANSKAIKKECLKIEITDTGVGIKKEEIDKLFHIEHSITTKGTSSEKGTGLGLVLCKDFVEKNNGKIWVESEEGKGSSFFFTLPLN